MLFFFLTWTWSIQVIPEWSSQQYTWCITCKINSIDGPRRPWVIWLPPTSVASVYPRRLLIFWAPAMPHWPECSISWWIGCGWQQLAPFCVWQLTDHGDLPDWFCVSRIPFCMKCFGITHTVFALGKPGVSLCLSLHGAEPGSPPAIHSHPWPSGVNCVCVWHALPRRRPGNCNWTCFRQMQ